MSTGPQFTIGKVSRHRDISTRLADTIQAMALCHNVTPVMEETSPYSGSRDVAIGMRDNVAITYQASSPDEVAIVKWTELVGLTLVYRDMTSIHLRYSSRSQTADKTLEYEILHVFPFTSETKRMGIIVRDRVKGEIFFYMKGADTVMSKIVQYNDWLDEECGNMAREGLRTLVIARRRLTEDHLKIFEER